MTLVPKLEYEAVSTDSLADLVVRVNAMILEGWKPCGGISVAVAGEAAKAGDMFDEGWMDRMYAQAMTRETWKETDE